MNSELLIRKAHIEDALALEKISVDTFIEAFASQNTKEDMDLFLKMCFNLSAIKNEISDIDIGYYMAFLEDKLIGYVKIKKASHSSFIDLNSLEISRIYVYEQYHNKKIGSALMQFVIDYAKANKFKIVWLGVWEHNPKAIEFYKRWGFEVFGEHVFILGNDPQNDLLMKKDLKNEKK
jgi:ribosomal protein S18 acetylase RimI-like enzyme